MAGDEEETPGGTEYGPGWEQELVRQGKEKPPAWAVRFFDAIYQAIVRAASAVWTHFFRQVIDRLGDLWSWSRDGLEAGENAAWRAALDSLKKAGLIDPALAGQILRLENVPAPLGSLLNLLLIGSLLGSYTGALGDSMFSPLRQRLNKEHGPNLPPAESMIHASFIAPEKTGEVRDILRRSGFKDADIDLMFIAQYQLYDVLTVRDLFLRKEIDEFTAHERLEEMGFTKTRIMEMKKLWTLIPPVQDILMMVAKEAFEPDEIKKYGLGDEFPEEQSEWLTKMGLSRYWQEKYWAAHWDYPSFGQVITCLQRQVDKPDGTPFNQDDVYDYYRVIEIPPFWRHMLTKIQYIPYTRVDTRRMHAMGVLTDEELQRAYQDQGYDETKAGKMAQFTIAYNLDTMKKLTQSQVIKAYRNKLLTKDEVHALLTPLKFRTEHIEFLLASEDFDETMDIQAIYLKTTHDRFTSLLIDELGARDALGKLNLPGRQIDALMDKWNTEKIIETKLPSKTDLDKFLRNEIINRDTYRNEMYRLGYSWDYVNWYTKLVEMKKAG